MQYWLFKSEPSTWSWDLHVDKGAVGEECDGVRNYKASNFMRQMTSGELGFLYQTHKDKENVGIVEVCANAHPDSTTDDARWECVDIRVVKPMQIPLALEQIKTDPRLTDMVLVNHSRLSVQPVTTEEWSIICRLGQTKPD